MLTLYHSGGASGFELTGSPLSNDEFSKLKSSVIRLLQARKQMDEVQTLQSCQFELSDGTNYFGDEFLVLHTKVSIEEYVKLTESMLDAIFKSRFRNIASAFQELSYFVRFIAVYADTDTAGFVVASPTPKTTSTTVERALRDAENLLHSSGAISAVDRVHTAIHAYFKAICDDEEISYPHDANLISLFALIRDKHPRMQPTGSHDRDVVRILRSTAAILESINNFRNRASVVHPNENLLDEPEAILAINSVRTLLHYLNAKLGE